MAKKEEEVDRVFNVLWIGDLVAPTGFARVNHNITENLPRNLYDIHGLGVNYWGDPHDYSIKIYPAHLGQDIYGLGRLPSFAAQDWDMIFLLNDTWVLDGYLQRIKKFWTEQKKQIPPIVVYFPIDATEFDTDWFQHYDIVTQAVTYTEFGKQEVRRTVPGLNVEVIPHGVDTSVFYELKDKVAAKRELYPDQQDFLESWVVLNANRNQPRKRIDIAMEAFAMFAQDKPANVKYYHHAGIKDMGYDAIKLARRFGIEDRLIVTSLQPTIQGVPDEKLNLIYNATDVGVNTSLGEGWGLISMEHAVTGAPQIVPDHTACTELWEDCGLLAPWVMPHRYEQTLTVGYVVKPEDVASRIQQLYEDKGLYDDLAEKGKEKFTGKDYSWKNVSMKWNKLFKKLLL